MIGIELRSRLLSLEVFLSYLNFLSFPFVHQPDIVNKKNLPGKNKLVSSLSYELVQYTFFHAWTVNDKTS